MLPDCGGCHDLLLQLFLPFRHLLCMSIFTPSSESPYPRGTGSVFSSHIPPRPPSPRHRRSHSPRHRRSHSPRLRRSRFPLLYHHWHPQPIRKAHFACLCRPGSSIVIMICIKSLDALAAECFLTSGLLHYARARRAFIHGPCHLQAKRCRFLNVTGFTSLPVAEVLEGVVAASLLAAAVGE
jgi:hypothetical protein